MHIWHSQKLGSRKSVCWSRAFFDLSPCAWEGKWAPSCIAWSCGPTGTSRGHHWSLLASLQSTQTNLPYSLRVLHPFHVDKVAHICIHAFWTLVHKHLGNYPLPGGRRCLRGHVHFRTLPLLFCWTSIENPAPPPDSPTSPYTNYAYTLDQCTLAPGYCTKAQIMEKNWR